MNKKQLIVSLIILFSLVIFFIVFQAWAGSNTYCIKCKSGTGRTVFNADIWDISSEIEKAEFSIDGEKNTWTNKDKAHVVWDADNGVFTIYITGKDGPYVVFWAIPSTFKIIIDTYQRQKYEFKANIHGTEPRKHKDLLSPTIELYCTFDYEV
ncbi:MAG: hypothetical protein FJZ16_00620 [Candidatus Omnitrophica bacterium]|nr:hypothetical protein [Candidatus Omnitrophota bacterium]